MLDIICLNRVHWNSLTNGIGVALRFVDEFFIFLGAGQVFEYFVSFAQYSNFHKTVAPPAGDVEAYLLITWSTDPHITSSTNLLIYQSQNPNLLITWSTDLLNTWSTDQLITLATDHLIYYQRSTTHQLKIFSSLIYWSTNLWITWSSGLLIYW